MANYNTQEERKQLEKIIAQMKEQFNGCPLFEGREKGKLEDLENQVVIIEDIFQLNDYHAIVFRGIENTFFLTGGALKDLCNDYPPEAVIGREIKILPLVKTKSKRDFRPIQILG